MGPIDLSPGALFAGQFRIVRPLAKGGMGAVYVVEQVGTGRERALKLMHPMLVSDAKSTERFEREAQVGSRIESDHIVEVIGAGVEIAGPTPWICMELLRGETLADRVEKRGVPRREETLEILRQLGHAMGAAHRAGIVHRDLKPENIFLAESRRDGVPFTLKVLDFGVATLTNELQGPKTTQGVGSPLWMAPEQTNVGKVVLATDVWALGLIAFYLLTGQSYWRTAATPGSTITALLVEIMVESLDPASQRAREVAPGVTLPAGFDAWFARCVTRDLGARFPDASAAFGPLLSLMSANTTLPEAFLATAAVPPSSSGTQPTAGTQAQHALAATQPGVPLGSSGPVASGPWSSGPQASSSAPAYASHSPAQPLVPQSPTPPLSAPTVVSARPRRIWPWVVLGALGLGGLCAVGVTYEVVRGVGEVVSEVGSSGVLEGHLQDPESGAIVDLSAGGIMVTLPDGGVIRVGAPMAPLEAETETGTETEPGSETESETGTEPETEAEAETETGITRPRARGVEPLGVGRRRARRAVARELLGSPASPALHASYRQNVIDPCLRGSFEGEAVPQRMRYVVHISGGAVRIEGPRDTPLQVAFVRCVVMRTQGQTDGDYAYTLP